MHVIIVKSDFIFVRLKSERECVEDDLHYYHIKTAKVFKFCS